MRTPGEFTEGLVGSLANYEGTQIQTITNDLATPVPVFANGL